MFDVSIEGILAIDKLDIVAAAGSARKLYVVSVPTTVLDGFATIEFIAGVDNPSINAIEVLSLSTGIPVGPVMAPAKVPVASPVTPPKAGPMAPPIAAPVVAPTSGVFNDVVINCGSGA